MSISIGRENFATMGSAPEENKSYEGLIEWNTKRKSPLLPKD
ncbi:hypothetical protein SAMN05421736_12175 [Evansella caseinilytica]|uniref:Uncharacterized protein n=1 Tax=Evansella caseinilytica TaxID=1503961 RepID=A0A1H3UHT9_9BACI|nr:hypothetical protein SAMN05421736_12175 [Evansella caseinilytica]